MKLLIAIPTNDYMHYQFVECLTKLVKRLDEDGIDYDIAYQGATLVYVGRDKLANKAMNECYTHMLWLDSDMIFTEDLLDDLMYSGKPFVTGIAHSRRAPHVSCIFKEIWPKVDRWEGCEYPIQAFRIGGCGFACVLIETEIVRNVYNKNGTAFFPMRELGEDLAFCKRATDMGYEIWAEPSVKLGHIGHITIYPEYEELYRSSIYGDNNA
ncbi:MAG: hypothetical protein IKE94_09710 [Aeriscardovia sp.]|nr:hypothetical protein [Aeriscardovia sp.]